MAITTSDFKTGLTIEYEGNVYQILEFQHVKPGKGGAFVRSKLRNLMNGNTIEKTWRTGDKMDSALVERRQVEYLYRDGEDLVFMDMDDYEQGIAERDGIRGHANRSRHPGRYRAGRLQARDNRKRRDHHGSAVRQRRRAHPRRHAHRTIPRTS